MSDLTATLAHEIIIAQSKEEIQHCYDVRVAVFHNEQKFPLDTEFDEFAEDGAFLTRENNLSLTSAPTPIGTIRAYKAPGGYYKLSRLAVLKDYRKYGFGRELVSALHDWVKSDAQSKGAAGSVDIVSHSQIPVKGFYSKFGYHPEGEEFDEDGDPHQKMVFQLLLV